MGGKDATGVGSGAHPGCTRSQYDVVLVNEVEGNRTPLRSVRDYEPSV